MEHIQRKDHMILQQEGNYLLTRKSTHWKASLPAYLPWAFACRAVTKIMSDVSIIPHVTLWYISQKWPIQGKKQAWKTRPTQDWYSNICEKYIRPQRLLGTQTSTAQKRWRSEWLASHWYHKPTRPLVWQKLWALPQPISQTS